MNGYSNCSPTLNFYHHQWLMMGGGHLTPPLHGKATLTSSYPPGYWCWWHEENLCSGNQPLTILSNTLQYMWFLFIWSHKTQQFWIFKYSFKWDTKINWCSINMFPYLSWIMLWPSAHWKMAIISIEHSCLYWSWRLRLKCCQHQNKELQSSGLEQIEHSWAIDSPLFTSILKQEHIYRPPISAATMVKRCGGNIN